MHTLYDLLRRLVEGGAWSEEERKQAANLITELERTAAFGNVVQETQMKGGK